MSRFGIAAALLVGACLGSVSAMAAPSVALAPSGGHPMATTQVSGSGFGANKAVDVYWDTTDKLLIITDGSGAFPNTPLQVPADAPPGQHWVTAVERDNGNGAQKTFTVRTNWATFGFDAQNRHYNPYENVVSASNANQLDTLWSVALGNVQDAPAVSSGVVYAGSDSGFYAINASTGALRWAAFQCAEVIGSSPTVAGNTVYVGCYTDGKVYAYSTSNGSLKWSAATGGNIFSSPVVSNGIVYVGSYDGKLYAWDATTGASKWTATTTAASAITASPAVNNGIVYIGSSDHKVYAFNAATGAPIWTYSTGGAVEGSPIVGNGTVYAGSDDGFLYALSAATGAFYWSYNLGNPVSMPAFANGIVYVGSSNSLSLTALTAGTGKLVWSTNLNGSSYFPPNIANGVLYVAAGFYTHAVDARTGADLWAAPDVGNQWTSPVIADGVLYVGSGPDGGGDLNLHAFALDSGDNAVYRRNPGPPSFATLHPDFRLEAVRPNQP